MNPTLSQDELEQLEERVRQLGILTASESLPCYPQPPDHANATPTSRVPAAWLIERAGMHKGMRQGPVGISSRHTLALIHHGGGSSAALIKLAKEIRDAVHQRFGILLRPEPVFIGFETPPL